MKSKKNQFSIVFFLMILFATSACKKDAKDDNSTLIGLLALSSSRSTSTTATVTYTIGGTITGLTASGLVLTNNSSNDLTVSSGATSFTFTTLIANGSSYSVKVKTNPTGLSCTINSSKGSGVVNGTNVTNVSVICSAPKRIFMTTSTYQGTLGGITGADAKCTSDTSKPSTGTYKALIAAGTTRRACSTADCSGGASEGVDWVLTANTNYYRTDGTTIIGTTNANAVFTFAIDNVLSSATTVSGGWTGLQTDWTSAAENCSTWTSTTGTGVLGNPGASNTNFIRVSTVNCTNIQILFCVEQ